MRPHAKTKWLSWDMVDMVLEIISLSIMGLYPRTICKCSVMYQLSTIQRSQLIDMVEVVGGCWWYKTVFLWLSWWKVLTRRRHAGLTERNNNTADMAGGEWTLEFIFKRAIFLKSTNNFKSFVHRIWNTIWLSHIFRIYIK